MTFNFLGNDNSMELYMKNLATVDQGLAVGFPGYNQKEIQTLFEQDYPWSFFFEGSFKYDRGFIYKGVEDASTLPQSKPNLHFQWYLWFSLTLILALRDRTWCLSKESELNVPRKYFLLLECSMVLSLCGFLFHFECFEGRHYVFFTIVTP